MRSPAAPLVPHHEVTPVPFRRFEVDVAAVAMIVVVAGRLTFRRPRRCSRAIGAAGRGTVPCQLRRAGSPTARPIGEIASGSCCTADGGQGGFPRRLFAVGFESATAAITVAVKCHCAIGYDAPTSPELPA